MDFSQNYFELFGIPKAFLVDTSMLADKYRQLQKELHPDKFASKSASEQRLSVQFSSHINTAYQTLKSPLLCAEYLLELADFPVNSHSLTIDDGAFLYKQMEWRETLADLSAEVDSPSSDVIATTEQLEALMSETVDERQQLLESFERCFQQQKLREAKQIVAKLHFVEKMLSEIDRLEERLLD